MEQEKDNLITDYFRFTFNPGNEENLQVYRLVVDSGFLISKIVHETIKPEDRNEIVDDALILFQMTMMKGIAILNLCHGLHYQNSLQPFQLSPLYDPMSVGVLTRSQFEAYSIFHSIFLEQDSTIQELLYDCWVISGLKTRQSFNTDSVPEELKKKADEEKKALDYHLQRLTDNEVYKKMPPEKQKWFDYRVKKKKSYEFLWKDGEPTLPGWRDLFLNTGVRNIFYHQYSFLSLLSHPSNVSVFQFQQMFLDRSNFDMTMAIMNRSKEIMAFLIMDYCNYIPAAKTAFSQLPEINQILIDAFNYNFRENQNPLYTNREAFYSEIEKFFVERHKQRKKS